MKSEISTNNLTPTEMMNLFKKRKEEDLKRIESEKIVILERKQVNTNNPAIAELWIKFPESVTPPHDILGYWRERKKRYNISAKVHKIERFDPFTYVLEIRSVLPMYKWMEYFISSFRSDYGKTGKGYNIEVRGEWDKYEGTV